MHKIDSEYLHTTIAGALRSAPPSAKRLYRSKLPIEVDEGARRLAMVICNIIDNDSTWVIRGDETGDGHPVDRRPGKLEAEDLIPPVQEKLGM